jgi:two-component system, OmpR family, osmolarity sensor histidine kinase EnvZ
LHRRVAQPLAQLTQAVAAPDAHSPIVVADQGLEEVRRLTAAFNAQRARLAAMDSERAVMLAGVSHDIRTPLAKLRLAVEMLANKDEQLAATAHRQVGEIDRLLGQFLVFAKGPNSEPRRAFDLDALVSEVVAFHQADGADVLLQGDTVGAYNGRPESLRRALNNLLENAARHGRGPFIVRTDKTETAVAIAVCDHGDGAPEQALERLATPFFRAEEARGGGAGLGLAIVAQIARAHGGALHLRNLTPQGFEARLELPPSP